LLERLSDAGNIAVAKDSETSFKEAILLAIALGELILEEADDRLGRGEASCHGAMLLTVIIFRSVSREEDDNARFEDGGKGMSLRLLV
jgi:hypothetical protein